MTMNDVYRVMLDVSALATRGSDLTRRIASEHERRANEHACRRAEEAALRPVSIVAVGRAKQSVERLTALRAAIGRTARIAAGLGDLRVRLTRGRLLGARQR